MTSIRVSTCIVGGGPAGLLLGLLLAKRGADVIVLEGHETFEREFRGEVLQPSTAHLLDELGLLEYILAEPHSILERAKVRLNGKEVGEFTFKKISPEYPYAIWMPQPIFLAALLRKAEPFPTFTMLDGREGLEAHSGKRRVVGVSGLASRIRAVRGPCRRRRRRGRAIFHRLPNWAGSRPNTSITISTSSGSPSSSRPTGRARSTFRSATRCAG